jgi:hypothetical protein
MCIFVIANHSPDCHQFATLKIFAKGLPSATHVKMFELTTSLGKCIQRCIILLVQDERMLAFLVARLTDVLLLMKGNVTLRVEYWGFESRTSVSQNRNYQRLLLSVTL